jgi:hypothetical protein
LGEDSKAPQHRVPGVDNMEVTYILDEVEENVISKIIGAWNKS